MTRAEEELWAEQALRETLPLAQVVSWCAFHLAKYVRADERLIEVDAYGPRIRTGDAFVTLRGWVYMPDLQGKAGRVPDVELISTRSTCARRTSTTQTAATTTSTRTIPSSPPGATRIEHQRLKANSTKDASASGGRS
jgi:hypothetical protein